MSLTSLLAALPWALPYAGMRRLASTDPNLRDAEPVVRGRVSVIVPARNEAHQVATVVGSVLASSYPDLELIVVDDRSTDGTADVVAAFAARDPRCRLVRGEALPPGWYGKPWACLQGARAATGDILVFTDADTNHDPELLGRAVAMREQLDADLFTISPRQLCLTFWERLIMPQIWVLLGLRYHPAAVNRATRPRDVVANGQFLLCTRAAYERIGTHEAVAGEVVEDLALAQRTVRLGLRLRFAFAEAYMQTRMYRNLRELVEGWSKNLYIGSRLSFRDEPVLRTVAPLLIAAPLLFWLLPAAVLLLAAAGVTPGWALPALVAWLLASGFWALVSFGMGAPMGYGLLHPVGAAASLGILARSWLRGARKVEWRGRVYDEVRATVREAAPPGGGTATPVS